MTDLSGNDDRSPHPRGRPTTSRVEGGLWLIGFGAVAAVTAATLIDTRVGYWIIVGLVVLAILAVEAFLGWQGAWLAIAVLGAAGLASAVVVAAVLRPAGAAVLALAVGGLAVAAGGVLLRPRHL